MANATNGPVDPDAGTDRRGRGERSRAQANPAAPDATPAVTPVRRSRTVAAGATTKSPVTAAAEPARKTVRRAEPTDEPTPRRAAARKSTTAADPSEAPVKPAAVKSTSARTAAGRSPARKTATVKAPVEPDQETPARPTRRRTSADTTADEPARPTGRAARPAELSGGGASGRATRAEELSDGRSVGRATKSVEPSDGRSAGRRVTKPVELLDGRKTGRVARTPSTGAAVRPVEARARRTPRGADLEVTAEGEVETPEVAGPPPEMTRGILELAAERLAASKPRPAEPGRSVPDPDDPMAAPGAFVNPRGAAGTRRSSRSGAAGAGFRAVPGATRPASGGRLPHAARPPAGPPEALRPQDVDSDQWDGGPAGNGSDHWTGLPADDADGGWDGHRAGGGPDHRDDPSAENGADRWEGISAGNGWLGEPGDPDRRARVAGDRFADHGAQAGFGSISEHPSDSRAPLADIDPEREYPRIRNRPGLPASVRLPVELPDNLWPPRDLLDRNLAENIHVPAPVLPGAEEEPSDEVPGGARERGLPGGAQKRGPAGSGGQRRGLSSGVQDRGPAGRVQERGLPDGVQDRGLAGGVQDRGLPGGVQERGLTGGGQDAGTAGTREPWPGLPDARRETRREAAAAEAVTEERPDMAVREPFAEDRERIYVPSERHRPRGDLFHDEEPEHPDFLPAVLSRGDTEAEYVPAHSRTGAPARHAAPETTKARRGRLRRRTVLVAYLMLVAAVLLAGHELRNAEEPAEPGRETAQRAAEPAEIRPAPAPVVTRAEPMRTGAGEAVAAARPGEFRYVATRGPMLGSGGRLYRFRVAVEETVGGTSPGEFAETIDTTLGDERSWINKGKLRLRRVPKEGAEADFTVYLASAKTSERMCAAGGLDTEGYTSCRIPGQVIINADRWADAVPDYEGKLDVYRRYTINHEVGHELGHGHEACPGKGEPAPVMQQQTFGLKGCTANPWPYLDGKRYAGKPVA